MSKKKFLGFNLILTFEILVPLLTLTLLQKFIQLLWALSVIPKCRDNNFVAFNFKEHAEVAHCRNMRLRKFGLLINQRVLGNQFGFLITQVKQP